MIVAAAVYLIACATAAAWVFADAKRFDFRDSRVAHTRAGWAIGTFLWLPLVWPLYRRARRDAPPRGSLAPQRLRGADRYEWAAFAVIAVPGFSAWWLLYAHDSPLQFAVLAGLAAATPLRVALARRLRV